MAFRSLPSKSIDCCASFLSVLANILLFAAPRVDDKSSKAPSSNNKVSIDREAMLGTGAREEVNTRKRDENEDHYEMESS